LLRRSIIMYQDISRAHWYICLLSGRV